VQKQEKIAEKANHIAKNVFSGFQSCLWHHCMEEGLLVQDFEIHFHSTAKAHAALAIIP
jgi:hypothetical protein